MTLVRALPVIIFLAVTLPLAFVLNVWQDDAYTLHTTRDGIAYAFSQAIGFEANAPLYFVLMTFWRHLNESAVWARLFSVFCAAGAVACVPALVKRYLLGLPWLPVTLAVALNPLTVWAGLEIRVYAMVILLSAILLLLFFDAFIAENAGTRSRVLYGAACIVAAYTQYYLLFLIAAQGVVLLFRRRSALPAYILTQCATLAAFVPLASVVSSQLRQFGSGVIPPTLPQSFRWVTQILAVYLFPLNALPASHLLYAALAVCALAALVMCSRYYAGNGKPLMMQILGGGYLFFVLGLFIAREQIFTRHAASLLIPVLLSAFSLFTFLRMPARSRAVAAFAILSIFIDVAALFATYRHLAKPGDWIRVASFISEREAPNQPIAVFEAENALPLDYYYHGKNRVVAVPRAIDFKRFDQRNFVVRSASDIAGPLRRAHGNGAVWFVTAGECNAANIQFGCGVVEDYVASHYRVVETHRFYKSTVRLLEPVSIQSRR